MVRTDDPRTEAEEQQIGTVEAAAAPPARRGGMFFALRFRNYRLFWSGQLVSVTGTFMQSTAQQWLVLQISRDPLALGIVGALQFGPLIVPFGGAIADRWPRRNVLIVTQTFSGLLALTLFTLTITDLVQLWHVYVLAFCLGIVNAVDLPSRQAFVSEMVPPENLLNAISLNSAQFNVSRIAGPGVAGALIALLGVPPLFLLNALSYVAVIAGLLLMRRAQLVPVPRAARAHGWARVRALGDGFRFIAHHPTLRITFIMVAVIGTMGFNFNVLLPLEATTVLHQGPAVFGLLTSALGAGALCGALLLARRSGPPSNALLIGAASGFGLLEAAIALPRTVPLTLAVIALTGFVMSSFGASANTRMQISSPPEIRGRVMSVYTMVFIGTTPIGNLVVSSIARSVGVGWSFVVSGLPCFLAAMIAFLLWRRQGRSSAVNPSELVAATPVHGDVPPTALPTAPDIMHQATATTEHHSLPARLWQRAPGQSQLQPRVVEPAD